MEEWLKLRRRGEFDPPSTQGTILFPGMDGGGEWGGTAYDAKAGLLYVNANEMAWKVEAGGAGDARRRADDGQGVVRALLRLVPSRRLARKSSRVPIARRTSARAATSTRSRALSTTAPDGCRGYPELHSAVRRAIVDYVVDRAIAGSVRGDTPTPFDVRYSLDGYIRFTDPDGFPAISRPGAPSRQLT